MYRTKCKNTYRIYCNNETIDCYNYEKYVLIFNSLD